MNFQNKISKNKNCGVFCLILLKVICYSESGKCKKVFQGIMRWLADAVSSCKALGKNWGDEKFFQKANVETYAILQTLHIQCGVGNLACTLANLQNYVTGKGC